MLKPYGRKIGPDPASIDAAMIGGIAANNASGMCCGTSANSYRTLAAMRVILADGTLLDTADDESSRRFREDRKALLDELSAIRQEILADRQLREKIRKKYRIKNTTGYSLNSFLDFEDPLDILTHLMIGSEGTLGFIAGITYQTVEDHPLKSCALVIFNEIRSACNATARLKNSPVAAVELMDESSLRSMEGRPGVPSRTAPGSVALLIDVRASSRHQLQADQRAVAEILDEYHSTACWSPDEQSYADLWKVRKGLFPIVGANRMPGTTVIIEDICFPIESLAEGTLALRELLSRHGYESSVIFGHALEGNLHFVFTQDFNSESEVRRYAAFMDDLAGLVAAKYGGSLKAEHGTGRNMAPFVEAEWGRQAYNLMLRIKQVFDPQNILNPEVIISKNPRIHLENLKPIPLADDLVDTCIECGFCEPVCPSRNLTLSPRQRIAVWREMSQRERLQQLPESWRQSFSYQGEQTCAGDGMCSTRCPVGIDTGKLVKKIRQRQAGAFQRKAARFVASNFSAVNAVMRGVLRTAQFSRALVGKRSYNDYPQTALTLPEAKESEEHEVVYFASCLHKVMRGSTQSVPAALLSLLQKAGFKVKTVFESRLCCGLPFESKGFADEADTKADELFQELLRQSRDGRLPIICDSSPCSYRMIHQYSRKGLIIQDAVSFMAENLDRLEVEKSDESMLLYSVCSQKKAGRSADLLELASACSNQVTMTEEIACCGFAGDRGFSHPELNAAALRTLKTQATGCSSGWSSSLSCEIGLEKHSGLRFGNILNLLDRCTSAIENIEIKEKMNNEIK